MQQGGWVQQGEVSLHAPNQDGAFDTHTLYGLSEHAAGAPPAAVMGFMYEEGTQVSPRQVGPSLHP